MRPGVHKLVAIVGVGVVFILGMIAGGVVTLGVVARHAENLLTREGSDRATERLARHLANQLHCDAGQREQLMQILRSAHGEIWEIRTEAAPRVHEVYRRTVAQIRATLRPEQVKTLDEIVARQTQHLHLNDALSVSPAPAGTPPASVSPTPVAL